ncbi:DUF806 family protein [Limosilactobacillus sp. WF-MT5-A]|uniref:DUF806 family protein n=1 Tax=Limosilactobacillus agrestis TaxID=2759748 RepID=UPI0015FD5862|nr:DUF806 family protein [Limosilactobacillus agrestis]MBB1099881.1 DUF806 family protein [Limosilactobacillus agrestis]MCD7120795.1 DUF806 family protein [Limosilactobacillus agrestis]MCD7126075.1 DUF806 family protein [Limosilactobacillus agrestis]
MELPTTQAKWVIESMKLPWIDKIVVGQIPRELADTPNKTICRISEYLNEPTYYANATFKGWTIGVEVQIFYKLNSGIRALNNEIDLAREFVKNNWTIENSEDHIQDPDTRQVIKVFYFSKDLIIKESEN